MLPLCFVASDLALYYFPMPFCLIFQAVLLILICINLSRGFLVIDVPPHLKSKTAASFFSCYISFQIFTGNHSEWARWLFFSLGRFSCVCLEHGSIFFLIPVFWQYLTSSLFCEHQTLACFSCILSALV